MQSSVLIAYSTRSGSTAEVAEAIAAAMLDAGVGTEVLPVAQVNSLTGREAVILGAPLYIGRFPKEFHQFVHLHHEALHYCRPWVFVVGPTRAKPEDFAGSQKQAERQLGAYPWLSPRELHVFGGRWSTQNMPFPFSLLRKIPGNPMKKIPEEDIRDWAAIRDWGAEVARKIRAAA